MEYTIQWFPGHMAKTRRKIQENLKLVDVVAEILDARIPVSSRNPELDGITAGKPHVRLMNKADMADEAATKRWVAFFRSIGSEALPVDCKSGKGLNAFDPLLRRVLQDRLNTWTAKGMGNRPIRVMVVGIPNTGKSTFINRLAKGGKAKAEDRPGVTRNSQWFVTATGIQLLDTPGVLWPKFEDQKAARRLAFTGAIRDEILDVEELAGDLLELLAQKHRDLLVARYGLPEELPPTGRELLDMIGRKRGMLISGGEINIERAAITVLDEFRAGKIGRITLELPDDELM